MLKNIWPPENKFFIIILIVMLFSSLPAQGEDKMNSYPPCKIQKTEPVHFRNMQSEDLLYVSIEGNPCYEAKLEIKITSKQRKVLYYYHSEFKIHTPVQWDDVGLPSIANEVAEDILKEGFKSNTSELPPYLPPEEYYEENYDTIKVTKEYYEKLRKKRLPIFNHSTNYESWQDIIWDERRQRSIILFTGGV